MFTITCYGKTETYRDAQVAIRYYSEGIASTEGAEQMRYISIVSQLQAGKTVIVDTDPEYNPNY